jgi:hypothetical protein
MSMTDILCDSETWDQLYGSLESLVDINGLAAETGALRRRRRVRDLGSLLRLALAYGLGQGSLKSTAIWAYQAGIAELSDVALLKRLCGASGWLMAVAMALLSRLNAGAAVASDRRLRLVDATCLSIPGSTGTDWRLHAVFDPVRQCFVDLELTDGKGGERLDRFTVTPGDIWIGDRGYATAPGVHHVLKGGADIIIRAGWNAFRLAHPTGDGFNLFEALRQTDTTLGCSVTVEDVPNNRTIANLRLVAWRKSPEATAKERRRLRQDAKRKGKTPDARSLEAAEWVIIITSLDQSAFPAETVLALYRIRWQIELAFKRLKSLGHLDTLQARKPELARAWIAANIIAAVLIGQTTQEFLDSPPSAHRKDQKATFDLADLPACL